MINLDFDKIKKGVASGFVGNILNFFQKIIFIPLFIKFLGEDVYSSWLTLISIVSYFTLLDLGSSQAIIGNLQRNFDIRSRVEKEMINYIIFFFFFPIIIFFIFFLILLFNKDFLEYFFLINRSYNYVLIILSLHTIISITLTILINFYSSINLFFKSSMIANLYIFLQLVISVLLLLFNFGIFAISVTYLLQSIVFILILLKKISKHYNINFFNFKKLHFIVIKKIIKKSFPFFFFNLSTLVSMQGIILIFSILSNSINLIIYSSLKSLTSLSIQLNSLIFSSIWFNISRIFQYKNEKKFHKFFLTFFQISNCNTVILALIFSYSGHLIVNIWIGDQFIFSKFFLHLIVSSMITQNLILSLNYYFQAKYKLRLILFGLVFFSFVKIFSFYFTFKMFNVENALLLQIILDIFFILFLISKIYYENLNMLVLKCLLADLFILSVLITLILYESAFSLIIFFYYLTKLFINIKKLNAPN